MQWLTGPPRRRLSWTALSRARRKSGWLTCRSRTDSWPRRCRRIDSRTGRQWIPIRLRRRCWRFRACRWPCGRGRPRRGGRSRRCMAPGSWRACGRFPCRRNSCRRRRYGRTRRRFGDCRARCRRNFRGLHGRNNNGLWNYRRWRWSDCGLCFHGGRSRRGSPDRLGNNGSGRRRNRRRRWRRDHGRLHAGGSGSRIFRNLIRYRLLFGLDFGFGDGAKMLAHLYRGFHFNRTGMRFLLGDSGFGQIVNDGLCLDLELASQFVDSDLIRIGHCPPGRLLFSVLV